MSYTKGDLIWRIESLKHRLNNPKIDMSDELRKKKETCLRELDEELDEIIKEESRNKQTVLEVCEYLKKLHPFEKLDTIDPLVDTIDIIKYHVPIEITEQYYVTKCLNNSIPDWLKSRDISVDNVPNVIYEITRMAYEDCLSLSFDAKDWIIHIIFEINLLKGKFLGIKIQKE